MDTTLKVKLILEKIFYLYFCIYYFLTFTVPIYVVMGLTAILFDSNQNLNTNSLNACINLLINTPSIWLWSKIFKKIPSLFENKNKEYLKADLQKISYYFLYIFLFNGLSALLRNTIFQVSTAEPVAISKSIENMHIIEIVFSAVFVLFGMILKFGEFLTPSTTGLSTLIIALILFYLSKKGDQNI